MLHATDLPEVPCGPFLELGGIILDLGADRLILEHQEGPGGLCSDLVGLGLGRLSLPEEFVGFFEGWI